MSLQDRFKKASLPVNHPRRWLNLQQLAEYMGAHPNGVRELVRTGKLRKRTIGHTWIVDRLDVDRFLESKED